tara:strand:+ start:579 stop:770 length:192 start_codon:yes stop_codon:yes gene_type:complete
MIESKKRYEKWKDVPYKTQLRILRVILAVVNEHVPKCKSLFVKSGEFNINDLLHAISEEQENE